MKGSIVITPNVINTIKALPSEERKVIANALISDIILGNDPKDELSPMHEMIYSIIRFYIKQDSMRHRSEEYALSAI